MPGTSSWQLREGEQVIACNTSLLGHKHFLIGITRVRNEALILRDTLDYVGRNVDAIVAYDDASTDRTLEILGGHPKVALIVTNQSWVTSCARCTIGVMRSSRMRSRCDLSENRSFPSAP